MEADPGRTNLLPAQRVCDWLNPPRGNLEQEFFADFQHKSVDQQRAVALIGCFMYAVNGLMYAWLHTESFAVPAFLCLCFVAPGLALLGGLTFLDVFARWNQRLVTACCLAVFVPSGIAFMLWSPPEFDLYARPAIVLLTMCLYITMRLLWPYALTLALSCQVAQVLTAIYIHRWTSDDVWSMLGVLAGANIVGLFTAAQLGAGARRDFTLARHLLQEQVKSERLLLNILPAAVAMRLKNGTGAVADRFEAVTVLFADLVGFTEMSAQMTPEALVYLLDEVFSRFDELADRFQVEKIKTIGDAYMVVSGLPERQSNHAAPVARMALAMLAAIEAVNASHGTHLSVRIGINTGPVVAGVIGRKRLIYDLWGDTVNVASRMESHGTPGGIQVTESTRQALGGQFVLASRGAVAIKGRGDLLTHWLTGEAAAAGAA